MTDLAKNQEMKNYAERLANFVRSNNIDLAKHTMEEVMQGFLKAEFENIEQTGEQLKKKFTKTGTL